MQVALHRHTPDAKHVVRGEHQGAVHIDLGGCVESVKDQVHVGAGQQGRSRVEVQPVLPALLLDPLQLGFVVAEERVGNLLVGQQIKVNVARNGGRQPAVLALLCSGRDLPELPAMMQGQNSILCRLGLCARHLSSHANNRAQQDAAHCTTGTCCSHPTSSIPSA